MAAPEDEYLPVGERPEWAGVAPCVPPPTPQPVVAIARDPLQGDLMDYFWAAVAAGELSTRVLELTGEIIRDLNSSNYTVWEWRWRCVQALGGVEAHAAGEKELMRSVATSNPKNYQLWNYRRRLALALGPAQAEEEMAFSEACLQHDAKNYHAWAHRQAILLALAAPSATASNGSGDDGGAAAAAAAEAHALWSAELAYTERLLRRDVRNNSAWNQRIFVLRNAPIAAVGVPAESYQREVEFAAAHLRLAPHNESVWEALRGLAAGPGAPRHALAADPRFLALCLEVLCSEEDGEGGLPGCAPALSMLADMLLEQAALLEEAAAMLAVCTDAVGADGKAASEPAAPVAQRGGSCTASTRKPGRVLTAAAAARRLARQVLERQLVADPIKRPYLQLELAAVEAVLATPVAS